MSVSEGGPEAGLDPDTTLDMAQGSQTEGDMHAAGSEPVTAPEPFTLPGPGQTEEHHQSTTSATHQQLSSDSLPPPSALEGCGPSNTSSQHPEEAGSASASEPDAELSIKDVARRCGKNVEDPGVALCNWDEHIIRLSDFKQFDKNEYMSGTMMELFMRYVVFDERPFSCDPPITRPRADEIHVFNTYLLRQYQKRGYDSVSRALGGRQGTMDVFSKRFLVFPVFQEGLTPEEVGHWSVIVLVRPDLSLKPCGPQLDKATLIKPLVHEGIKRRPAAPPSWVDSPFAPGRDEYPHEAFPLVDLFGCDEPMLRSHAPHVKLVSSRPKTTLIPTAKLSSDLPTIVYMDSLSSPYSSSEDAFLVQTLIQEHAIALRRPELKLSIPAAPTRPQRANYLARLPSFNLVCLSVPKQPNSVDCGYYSVFSLKEFFRDPDQLLAKLEHAADTRKVEPNWDVNAAAGFRSLLLRTLTLICCKRMVEEAGEGLDLIVQGSERAGPVAATTSSNQAASTPLGVHEATASCSAILQRDVARFEQEPDPTAPAPATSSTTAVGRRLVGDAAEVGSCAALEEDAAPIAETEAAINLDSLRKP
ncbi:hypothetical protein OC844_007499 [Tilletia horrida]|nr:hypothetical protein OC844_007499 [Tilletia horrida]